MDCSRFGWRLRRGLAVALSAALAAGAMAVTASAASGTPAPSQVQAAAGQRSAYPVTAAHAASATGNTVTVTNPGNLFDFLGSTISMQIHASDSAPGQTLTFTAKGLPPGVSIRPSGLISGTLTALSGNSVTLTATDTTGAHGSATFSWLVYWAPSGYCNQAQLLGNPGFEAGTAAPWTSALGVINSSVGTETAHSGSWFALLDGYGTAHTDTLSQTVAIGGNCDLTTFSFWLHIDTAETTTTTAFDKLTVTANGTTIATFSNLNHASGYQLHTYSLAGFVGSSVTITFTATENCSRQTSFVVDDIAINPAGSCTEGVCPG